MLNFVLNYLFTNVFILQKLACLSLYFTQVNDALKIQERTIRVQNNYESTQQSFQRATDQVCMILVVKFRYSLL